MIKYNLAGIDGNAFAIMGYVIKCMKKENKSTEEIDAYIKEAESSFYDHLLATSALKIDELNEPYLDEEGEEVIEICEGCGCDIPEDEVYYAQDTNNTFCDGCLADLMECDQCHGMVENVDLCEGCDQYVCHECEGWCD